MNLRCALLVLGFGIAALALSQARPAHAQETETPPTTLPFEPTVPSAPPTRPSYPQPVEPAPPPGDPLCYEIGPVIRAGVIGTRFATLSPATAQGGVLGTFEAGEALREIGGGECVVVIPAASAATADAAFNQVTCPLAMEQADVAYLDDFRDQRDTLAERIGECPAVSRWTGIPPAESPLSETDIAEDFLFTHPEVPVEIVVRARHHTKTGQWPNTYLRSLSLVFRTPNPDRPEPPPPETIEAPAGE